MSMQQNIKTNFILFAFAFLLAAAVYVIKGKNQQSQNIYFPINVNAIEHILIKQTPFIELKKINDEWTMLQPETGKVNKKTIQNTLEMLATPVSAVYEINEVSLKELSLLPPNLQVLIDGEALEFGMLSPIDQSHYVKFKSKVYLARPFLLIRFSQNAAEFLKPAEVDVEPTGNGHDH